MLLLTVEGQGEALRKGGITENSLCLMSQSDAP